MTLSAMFQRSCEDFWFLLLRDMFEIWHAVVDTLFNWKDYEGRRYPPTETEGILALARKRAKKEVSE